MIFEETELWRRTLKGQSDQLDSQRETLRQAYFGFRNRAAQLVAEIGTVLPDLTVHDITHLDALWRVADQIAGSDYELNPAEAFVLGGAFLIHDAAHVVAAYDDGLDSIRQTIEWKDLIAQRFDGSDPSPGSPDEKAALFQVLRFLHASRARDLATTAWNSPTKGEKLYLIEQPELRDYYGSLIGEIAESHHWSAHKVVDVFENRNLTAPAFLAPATWTVDALKVAFLLRTADAAHVDAERAPWFLFALRQPTGISKSHWLFQSKMGQPLRTDYGELRLSSSPFGAAEREAWWLAYDVACLVDRELRDAQTLMRDCGRQPFAAVAVENVSDPERFAVNVRVEGWEPVNIGPTISNKTAVIEKLGGASLYGHNPHYALRELIQNAADAIRALRALGFSGETEGEIDVTLTEEANETYLEIVDTGIGMSRYVLTNVLLDFGRSLWSEEALRSELPGLASAGFESVGRFGIGFFSIFMLGKDVSIVTRRFSRASADASDQWLLTFEDGFLTRPTLRRPTESESLSRPGTRIVIRLDDDVAKNLVAQGRGKTSLQKFRQLVVRLCPTLDANVNVTMNKGNRTTVLKCGDWHKIGDKRLVNRTTESSSPGRLFDLRGQSGELLGRVTYGRLWSHASVTHGGLLAGKVQRLIGVILGENSRDLARSHAQPIALQEAWQKWAKEWLDANPECVRDAVIDLHPLCADRDLAVYETKGNMLTEAELEDWLKKRDRIQVLDGYVTHDYDDDVGESRFDDEFVMLDDVVAVPSSSKLFPELTGISPIDYDDRLMKVLQRTWKNFEYWDEHEAIGDVFGTEINRYVAVYERTDDDEVT